MRATISDLWNRLREYLHKVRAGKTVPMLDRGRAIARIERIDGRQAFDERLLRLEAAGLVRRPSRSLPMAVLKAKPPKSRRSVLGALLEERAGGALNFWCAGRDGAGAPCSEGRKFCYKTCWQALSCGRSSEAERKLPKL